MERKIGTENIFSQQPVFFSLFDRDTKPFDSQRIFCPDVYQSFTGTDAVTANGHGFDHGVRIPFHNRTVHKSSRVPFVGVTNDIFLIGLVFAGKFPFQTGRETAATPSTQSGSFDFVDNRFRSHLCQTIG